VMTRPRTLRRRSVTTSPMWSWSASDAPTLSGEQDASESEILKQRHSFLVTFNYTVITRQLCIYANLDTNKEYLGLLRVAFRSSVC
jgi:hypothetical protein